MGVIMGAQPQSPYGPRLGNGAVASPPPLATQRHLGPSWAQFVQMGPKLDPK